MQKWFEKQTKCHASKILFLLFFCMITPLVAQTDGWKTYQNTQYGYRIKYPDTWRMIEAKSPNSQKVREAAAVLRGNEIQKVTFLDDRRGWPGVFEMVVVSNPGQLDIQDWANHTFVDAFDSSLAYYFKNTTLGSKPANSLLFSNSTRRAG